MEEKKRVRREEEWAKGERTPDPWEGVTFKGSMLGRILEAERVFEVFQFTTVCLNCELEYSYNFFPLDVVVDAEDNYVPLRICPHCGYEEDD